MMKVDIGEKEDASAMNKAEIEKRLRDNRASLSAYHVKRMGLFGSQLHGPGHSRSDIDLLVEFGKTIDLFSFVHLTDELESWLESRVDLVTKQALKPAIRAQVLEEVEWLEGL
jgi:hypothetical protein